MKLPFQLDRYTLVELIGAGAFGQVYRAEVHGDMGFVSDFAVKVLDANVVASNPNVARQMGDEARILAQLDHPNIVKVIDFKHEDHDVLGDVYYMVLEFVRGVEVTDILDRFNLERRSMPAHAVLHMGLMVADALAHAHELVGRDGQPLAIVHRDLKPQNLMVNFRGQVKVLDFGIAKARDDRLAARTQEGQTKGTVFYMSPEQLTGDTLDGRADIYSLAAILFELLLGRRLLDVEVATPADLARAMHTAFEMDIDSRLEQLRLHLEAGHNGDLPQEAREGWLAVLRAALQKDPRYRPDSAQVFSEQLEWLRARHPVGENRNFWSQEASWGFDRVSGAMRAVVEEVPDVGITSMPTSETFFGMESGSVADEEMIPDISRPEIPPPEVPVTRAMSVVSGTVRAFGPDAIRQLGGVQPLQPLPPLSREGSVELDLEASNPGGTGDAPSVAQTLETKAHQPGEVATEPGVEGPTVEAPPPPITPEARSQLRQPTETTRPYARPRQASGPRARPDRTADGSRPERSRRRERKGGFEARLLLGVATLLLVLIATLAGVIVLRLVGDRSDTPSPEPAAAVEEPGATEPSDPEVPSSPPEASPPEPAELAAEQTAPQEADPGEPVEAVPAARPEPAPEPPRAQPPPPPASTERRTTSEPTPQPRPERQPEPRAPATTRSSPPPESSAGAAEVAASEQGKLYLSARPRCQVEIDGKPYGTSDVTRRGVSLPAGVYSVRFICDDEQECRDFGVKRAKKKLEVKPDEEVRFTADFYDINGNNEGR